MPMAMPVLVPEAASLIADSYAMPTLETTSYAYGYVPRPCPAEPFSLGVTSHDYCYVMRGGPSPLGLLFSFADCMGWPPGLK